MIYLPGKKKFLKAQTEVLKRNLKQNIRKLQGTFSFFRWNALA